jgi:hypothetical protein
MSTISSDVILSNLTDISSKPVAFAAHIPEIYFLTKLSDIFGILQELFGIGC